MDLRLCFENKAGVNIDDTDVFRYYAENYLSGFDVRWAGDVSIAHNQRLTTNLQPMWQYRIDHASVACRDYLCEYLTRNPMAGYFVHVFETSPGHMDRKIHPS